MIFQVKKLKTGLNGAEPKNSGTPDELKPIP